MRYFESLLPDFIPSLGGADDLYSSIKLITGIVGIAFGVLVYLQTKKRKKGIALWHARTILFAALYVGVFALYEVLYYDINTPSISLIFLECGLEFIIYGTSYFIITLIILIAPSKVTGLLKP